MLAAVWRIDSAGHPPVPIGPRGVVEDAEALCRGVIATVLRKGPEGHGGLARNGARDDRRFLEPADYDELLAFALGQIVVLQRQYDPSRAGILFRPGCSESSAGTSSTRSGVSMAATARNGRSPSSPPLTAATSATPIRSSDVDLSALPAKLRLVAATIGQMISDGYSRAEIAKHYGLSRPWVSARLKELEEALREQMRAGR